MRKFIFGVVIILLAVSGVFSQQTQPVLDITGVNATDLPTATVTVSILDSRGVPVSGLTVDDFTLSGELAEVATIVSVENVTADDLAFAVVLVIDTSSSMAGPPFDEAKQAAREFINAIGENDPVAIVAFDSDVRLVQDYTTDKTTLLTTIDTLTFGGQTALYEGALVGVQKASEAPTPRRAVILLSDGAEYGTSRAARADALNEAIQRGVSVYTIGLGYGTDRSYLQALSTGTNGLTYESPTPEQLVEIYGGVASLLRSQYIVTLDVDVPLDGTEYEFSLQAGDSTTDTAILRAPIPVPIVSIPNVPIEPLTQPTDFTAVVAADQELVEVNTVIGENVTIFNGKPYTLTVDPFLFAPGDYSLTFNAMDTENDLGSASADFTVAALPAVVTLAPDLSAEISQPVTVTVQAQGQTPTTGIVFSVDEVEIGEGESITLDPVNFAPGSHTLIVEVTSESGAVARVEQNFSVAALPPAIQLSGLAPSQQIALPTNFTIETTSQTPLQTVTATINDQPLTSEDGANFTIDPMLFRPGNVTLNVTVTDENGQTATLDTPLVIAALPPTVTINGLMQDDLVNESLPVSIEVIGQSPIASVVVLVGGEEVGRFNEAPYNITLEPLDFAPQDYTLEVRAADISGQETTTSLDFQFALSPFLTATPPTATTVPTETTTATATVDNEATSAVETQAAQSTFDAQVTLDTQSTLDAGATATREQRDSAAALRQATNDSIATRTAAFTPPTATITRTPRPTEVPPTDAPTSTDTPTDEPTATDTPTDEPTATDMPTEEVTPELTEEPAATEEVVAQRPTSIDPTSTPIGELTEIVTPGAPPDDSSNIAILAIICGVSLLLLLLIIFLIRRRA